MRFWKTLLTACLLGRGLAFGEVLDSIVARVDRNVITRSQVLEEVWILTAQGKAAASLTAGGVLETLIRRKLVIGAVQRLHLEVTPQEVEAEVASTAKEGGDPQAFWASMAKLGLSRDDVKERAREMLLMSRYLDLEREAIYVPEADVRSFLAGQAGAQGERSVEAARDEARIFLAARKYKEDLERWIRRQFAEGRVQLIDDPGADLPAARP